MSLSATALAAPREADQDETLPSPYCYPEFAGPGGERYLKKLLRQIVPMALYRTWEIFVEHQARGNECYLSLGQLAALAGRSLRTMQKNLASLSAKHLLVERAERKLFRGQEGSPTSRMVVVKDFSGLYALAHEYDTWLHMDTYIPPERAFASLLAQDASLVAKLRRFDNYRRMLYTHLPGPGPCAREEDRWFTEYHPDADATKAVEKSSASQASQLTLTTQALAKEVSKESPQRINESSQRDERKEDSCDSVPSSSEKTLKKEEEETYPLPDQPGCCLRGGQPGSARQAAQPVPKAPDQSQQHAPVRQWLGSTQKETPQPEPLARPALNTANLPLYTHHHYAPAPSGERASAQLPSHPLVCSFLQEIVAPFGDRNPKGSTTRVMRIIASASLEEAEVMRCLVRAYTIARDTRALRHVDPVTGQANRMPLFCTLFERFVQDRIQNSKWTYSWQQMENDLAADNRLVRWWMEYQAYDANAEHDPLEKQPVSVSQEDQSGPEEASPPVVGWVRREAAHAWGEHLLEALLENGYEAEVRVHLEGQWYQLVLVGEGSDLVLETPEQVHFVIAQLQRERS